MEQSLNERIAAVRAEIAQAARRAGREPEAITLVAVSKMQPEGLIREAAALGLRDFGENYVQEAAAKQDALGDLTHIRWHLIGHLQSNKASAVAGRFALIHGVDSRKLAQRLGAAALEKGTRQDILVQVHLGSEETKNGVAPDHALALCEAVAKIDGLALRGLMGIAPLLDTDGVEDDSRKYFAELRGLYEKLPPEHRQILSMGMSGDFETAIEEGATLVRIGSAIFGPRPARAS